MFTFCCDNLWKSKFMALEKPGKLGIFLSYFVATLYYYHCKYCLKSFCHSRLFCDSGDGLNRSFAAVMKCDVRKASSVSSVTCERIFVQSRPAAESANEITADVLGPHFRNFLGKS